MFFHCFIYVHQDVLIYKLCGHQDVHILNTKFKISYYTDYNYNKCCAITGLPSDCQISTIYKNVAEAQSCRLTVGSTLRGVYNTTKVPFGVYSKETMIRLDYLESRKAWVNLCKNCNSYNKTRNFEEGWHNLTLIAVFNNGIETLKVSFLVDI